MDSTSSCVSVYNVSLQVGLLSAGLLTWGALHYKAARGDIAFLVYALAFSATYVGAYHLGNNICDSPSVFSFTVFGVYTASALTFTVLYRLSPFHPLAGYPGPRAWWISSVWLSYVSYMGRRHLILDELHKQYGPYLRIGPDTLSINSPGAMSIYASSVAVKGDSYLAPGRLPGIALFFKQATEKIHSTRKRVWSSLFTATGIVQILPALEARTWELMDCLERRQSLSDTGTLNLTDCFYHWSYDLMGDMVFGASNELGLMKNGDPHNFILNGKIATAVLDSVGQTPWLMDLVWHLPAGKDMHELRRRAADMVRARINVVKPQALRDLMSYLIEAADIPKEDLELDAIVAIQGGSDNTSITMGLAFYFMLSEPGTFDALRSELEKAFPDPTGSLPPAELAGLPYLNAVVNEALRLGSPYFLPRVAPAGGMTIDDRFIPEDTVVAIAAYSQQTSPDNFFPDPLRFRPLRWFKDGLGPGTKANKSAIASFSTGNHACIAKAFAYQEMRHVIARLVLAYDMSLDDSFDVKAFRDGILNMRTTFLEKDLIVSVKRRAGVNLKAFERS
ncbi:cytochrome P450 [Auriscalpium vulgare]|uniref:Cytochrome P450 n=1 Tax=Auriscalpium vulgare TaxID=40419 RepID=A0ACB8RSU7_9AGAM|nr:cytochrome P450 [Auriscalpium vulgare]